MIEKFVTRADGELELLTSGSTVQVMTHAGVVRVLR
jgi:hypothetical protein